MSKCVRSKSGFAGEMGRRERSIKMEGKVEMEEMHSSAITAAAEQNSELHRTLDNEIAATAY